ncbi:YitT family protein [Neobacillus drentensis]|uniref:YitT family protein n=1 Tax=Neobacillus drentensis TaxID=220684 RepID=UPI003001EF24
MAILIGSLLIGIGVNAFLIPHHLLDGGIIGLSLILHYYFDFQTGLCVILFSMPLCIYAWFRERNYFYSSFHGLMVSSFFIDLLAPLQNHFPLPIILSALFGGALGGLGVGLMLRYQTSTAGTELLAHFLAKSFSFNIGTIILVVDGLVLLSGFKVLESQSFFYSILTILSFGFITSLLVKNYKSDAF